MKLKVKCLEWSAGLPVVMLNKKTAKQLGVHAKDRISIQKPSKNSEKFSTILDTVRGIVGNGEIAVSSEIKKRLNLKSGQNVEVSLSEMPNSLNLIKKKLKNQELSREEIHEIIEDIVNNSLSEVEVSLFVSAMYYQGMKFYETISLIEAILKTGNKISLNKKNIVDKHSIGGIPGNRTTPIVVSICAAAGLTFPKTSSRAITSAAGTSDVIEIFCEVEFSMQQVKKIVEKTGACMVWGGGLGMVPADSKIIQIEKMLKMDPEAQLLASIMAKKLSLGSKYILIDIPYGKYAKVSKLKAIQLKRKFERLGKYFDKSLRVVLTSGKEPIGNGVGPFLEMIDVVKVLEQKEDLPKDLEKKSIFLSGQLLELAKKCPKGKGEDLARKILCSGKAFEKFKEIIRAQKGKVKKLNFPEFSKDILATKNCKIKEINNKEINSLARIAGCPVDKFSGVYLYVHRKDKVKKGEKILTLYSESKSRLKKAEEFYKTATPIIFS